MFSGVIDDLEPLRQAASPEFILGHDSTGAGGHPDFDQGIDQNLGKGLDLRDFSRREVVGIDDGVVLVGGQGLLATPFAPQNHESEPLRQFGELFRPQDFYQADQ